MDDGYSVRQVRAIFFGEGMNNVRVKGDPDRDNPAVVITGNRQGWEQSSCCFISFDEHIQFVDICRIISVIYQAGG